MSLRRSRVAGLALAALLASLALLAQPSPERAQAGVVCNLGSGAVDAISGGLGAITGGSVGGGNPLGDTCDAVSDGIGGVVRNPLAGALKGVGNSIFEQITSWVSEGAAWLIAEVVKGIDNSTTPQLTSKGFLAQYTKMAAIAALLGMAMLLLAVLEGVAQGNATMLLRVALVNVPLAFIATSVAYVIVQLLLVATDGLCETVANAAGHNGQHFFAGAIRDLGKGGGTVGAEIGGATGAASGSAAVPLFVTFLAAVIGAFAAFAVWLELLMRDAAVYVNALFMPFSLAASIWPRWMGALRRTVELEMVVISSKFVIVSIIALAAGLLADPGEGVEPLLAASALMLLACFAPFVLLKLVPFAEGAMSAAYSRRSAAGGGVGALQIASNTRMINAMSRANWGGDSGVTLWSADGKGGGGAPGPKPGPRGGGGSPGGGSSGGGSSGGGAGSGSAAAAGAGALAAAPVAAARGAKGAAQRLEGSSVAQDAGGAGAARPAAGQEPTQKPPSAGRAPNAPPEAPSTPERLDSSGSEAAPSSEKAPRPAPEQLRLKPEKGSGK